MPKWMNQERYDMFSPHIRKKRIQYFVRCFDETGEPTFDPDERYTVEQAISMLCEWQEKCFEPCNDRVSVSIKLNLDGRQPDQQMRAMMNLPHAWGEQKKVAVFCNESEAAEVLKLGACKAGDDLEQAIKDDNIDFDILITTPQMMPKLAKLGKVLGPRKLMPSPKTGTVTTDVASAIEEFTSGGLLEVRTESVGEFRRTMGKLSMGKEKLLENMKALLRQVAEKAPPGAVKEYWHHVGIMSGQSAVIKCSLQGLPQPDVEDDEEDEVDFDW